MLLCIEYAEKTSHLELIDFLFVLYRLVELDDPYGTLSKQRSTEIGEGRITPTASTGKFITGLINYLKRVVLLFHREESKDDVVVVVVRRIL